MVSDTYDPAVPQSYYTGVFRYLLEFIESNERFIVSILRSRDGSFVRDLLEEQVRLSIDQHLKNEAPEYIRQSHVMLSVIYSGAIVSCGAWWAMRKNKPDKEQMIDLFSEFLMKL